ncbi:MAG: hypothetical protein ACREFJ_17380 [Acetobacteraceae bacterium]
MRRTNVRPFTDDADPRDRPRHPIPMQISNELHGSAIARALLHCATPPHLRDTKF